MTSGIRHRIALTAYLCHLIPIRVRVAIVHTIVAKLLADHVQRDSRAGTIHDSGNNPAIIGSGITKEIIGLVQTHIAKGDGRNHRTSLAAHEPSHPILVPAIAHRGAKITTSGRSTSLRNLVRLPTTRIILTIDAAIPWRLPGMNLAVVTIPISGTETKAIIPVIPRGNRTKSNRMWGGPWHLPYQLIVLLPDRNPVKWSTVIRIRPEMIPNLPEEL